MQNVLQEGPTRSFFVTQIYTNITNDCAMNFVRILVMTQRVRNLARNWLKEALEIVRNRRKNMMWRAHDIEKKGNAYDIEHPGGK